MAQVSRLSRLGLEKDSRPECGAFSVSILMAVYNERHMVDMCLRRLLSLHDQLILSMEVVVVDDCSSDGTSEILGAIANEDSRIVLVRHEKNQGKGAAVRTAIAAATGDVCVVFDADLEYNPEDIPALLVPFAVEGADAVFGSRYMAGKYRRALMHRHTMVNKFLTFAGNWFTDLNLSDIETGLKAVNTTLLKSIPLRCQDFRFEVELVFKLAKRRARIFETPIRYVPRSYQEGKKIRPSDGVLALLAMLHYWAIDDLYTDDEYGWPHLREAERTTRYSLWLGRALRPFIGDRVLEVEAGIGSLTNQFIPRESYIAADVNPNHLHYLRSYSYGKHYLSVKGIDASSSEDFEDLDPLDTVTLVNVLAHVDDAKALRNAHSTLIEGGRVIVVAPNYTVLYGSLDQTLGRKKRYGRKELAALVEQAGFKVEQVVDFNRFFVPLWLLNGRLLRRKRFSRLELKILDTLIPVIRRIDRLWPWQGLSVIVVGSKQ